MPEDIQGTLEKQGVSIRLGDAVFFHTGHGSFWVTDNTKYNGGEPGIGLAAAKWLIAQQVVLTGADSWSVEVVPGENRERMFEVHQWLIIKNGIYNLEKLYLDELANDKVYEFVFIFAPLKLKGTTGSPGNPIAVG